MNIALVDVDGHNFPNFALMKISAWHKSHGDSVEWFDPLFSQKLDRVYASKVFTFTPDYDYFPHDVEIVKGGTGYDFRSRLPDEIERTSPDYSIYPQYEYAIGFLSRGCIRKCPWCVVPKKEGYITQYADIQNVAQGRKHVVLMDNNFLANDPSFAEEQLQTAAKCGYYLDFNQGLDARLVNDDNARLLAACKWQAANGHDSYIRFSCDAAYMIPHIKSAFSCMREAGYAGWFFIYFLAIDVEETLDRISQVMSFDKKVNPFVMPFRNLDGDGKIANNELKRLARWCNMASIRKRCKFEEYKG